MSSSEAPLWSMLVASEWRSRCAPLKGESIPARVSARRTTLQMVAEERKPRCGARMRTNTRRVGHASFRGPIAPLRRSLRSRFRPAIRER